MAGKRRRGDGDPWVALAHGLVRDQPLGMTGMIVQVVIHAPGTRMRRSEALELGITEDDWHEVDGPRVWHLPAGFSVVLTPTGTAPDGGGGPVVPGPGW